VEDAGWEVDLEVAGREESSDGGQEDSEEEGHEEGVELNEGLGGGAHGPASGSASTHRFRSSHLIHPPVVPHSDNRVVIIPRGDR
jgi:hypothetical protein